MVQLSIECMVIPLDATNRGRAIAFVSNVFYVILVVCVLVMLRSHYYSEILNSERHNFEVAKQAGATASELTAHYVVVLQAEEAVNNDPFMNAFESSAGQICISVVLVLFLLVRIFLGLSDKLGANKG